MKKTLICLLAVAAVMTFAGGAFAALLVDYPIQVVTEDVSPSYKKDVVYVLHGESRTELGAFMKNTVPAALRSTGNLPEGSNKGTWQGHVEIPNVSNCHIFNYGNLPVRLRVRAVQSSTTRHTEDGHERFKVKLSDPWSVESYFVTQFTAVTRVQKNYVNKRYEYTKQISAQGTHRQYKWIDP